MATFNQCIRVISLVITLSACGGGGGAGDSGPSGDTGGGIRHMIRILMVDL
jgi:hypothetical protein